VAQAPKDTPVDPAVSDYVGAAAAVLGLPIRAEHRDGVERHFAQLAVLARLVDEHSLDRTDEPATVFHPNARP
jgi:hypothetical protein